MADKAPAEPAPRAAKPPAIASAVSGAIAGAFISAIVQPLDVVRTRMQADAAINVSKSTLATLRTVIAERGIRGLWMGTGPTVIRLSAGAALHMVLLEHMKGLLQSTASNGSTHLTAFNAAMTGGLSRALTAALLCPVTVVKTRMEFGNAATMQYRHTLHALQTIARTEGVAGLYKGLGPTVLTNAPFSAFYYMFYTRLKETFHGEGRPQALVNFSSGVVAAVAATLLTQPTDVVRTRVQLGLSLGKAASAGAAGAAPAGAWATFREVTSRQGAAALFTGAAPRIIKRTAQTALVWTIYEELVPRLSAVWLMAVQKAADKGAAAEGKPG